MEVNKKTTVTVTQIDPYLENGKQKTIKNPATGALLYQSILIFSDGDSGPVFSTTENPPYSVDDTVEALKKVNKAGKQFFSVKKITPFPKEEVQQPSNIPIKLTESLRETYIAIASVDKALAIVNAKKQGDLLDERNILDIETTAVQISKIITKVEKSVF